VVARGALGDDSACASSRRPRSLEAITTRQTLKTAGRVSVEVARTHKRKYNRTRERPTEGPTDEQHCAREGRQATMRNESTSYDERKFVSARADWIDDWIDDWIGDDWIGDGWIDDWIDDYWIDDWIGMDW